MEKILISACFLGQAVRYDGQAKELFHPLIAQLQQQNRLIIVCPEVTGGLSVPRNPAEINQKTGQVINDINEDVSIAFHKGANIALELCQKHQIRFALLKESSPSCGSNFVYNGQFNNTKIVGQGITTQLLMANGIKVFSELTISALEELLTV